MDNEERFCMDCGGPVVLADSTIGPNSEKYWYCRNCKKEVPERDLDELYTIYDEEEII